MFDNIPKPIQINRDGKPDYRAMIKPYALYYFVQFSDWFDSLSRPDNSATSVE